MTWQEFVLSVIGSLAWPAAVLAIALIIRKEMDK